MKLAGSERAKFVCCLCREESRIFLVTLGREYDGDKDEDVCWFVRNDLPGGWWVTYDIELIGGVIQGYCPKCMTDERRSKSYYYDRLMSPNARAALARLTGKEEDEL